MVPVRSKLELAWRAVTSRGRAVAVVAVIAALLGVATGSGLFMALINILPAWIVMIGRPLILSLGGDEPETT